MIRRKFAPPCVQNACPGAPPSPSFQKYTCNNYSGAVCHSRNACGICLEWLTHLQPDAVEGRRHLQHSHEIPATSQRELPTAPLAVRAQGDSHVTWLALGTFSLVERHLCKKRVRPTWCIARSQKGCKPNKLTPVHSRARAVEAAAAAKARNAAAERAILNESLATFRQTLCKSAQLAMGSDWRRFVGFEVERSGICP